ncbi:hypothetical protein EV379_1914 [Microterricola gilva]|uniref:Uncharacterized protein n=1 Tax=Microterricola gilva TaxID=393267 RepID=A0A4Q8ALW9_9MICO|nr:hypothetical protein [Microterricola gilva]RZU65580.1 hypothetical protein EV379_1914 [Microterricola gilva]
MSESDESASPDLRPWWQRRRELVTPELISGTVLVSAVIAVADESGRAITTTGVTVITMLVLWVSQFYIVAIASQARRPAGEPVHPARSIRVGLDGSVGLLIATVPGLLLLLLGDLGVLPANVAYWAALWAGVVVLAFLGWIAFSGRRVAWYWRLCGMCATAGFGVVVIILRILID